MDIPTFTAWLSQLDQLSPSQWEQLHTRIEQADASTIDRWLEAHAPTHCPHCHTAGLTRWGSAHGLPRYRCSACGRTSNVLTGSPLAHLRQRDRWLRFAQALIDGVSIRRAAAQCAIHKNTALRWRRRFLEAPAVRSTRIQLCVGVDVFWKPQRHARLHRYTASWKRMRPFS